MGGHSERNVYGALKSPKSLIMGVKIKKNVTLYECAFRHKQHRASLIFYHEFSE